MSNIVFLDIDGVVLTTTWKDIRKDNEDYMTNLL